MRVKHQLTVVVDLSPSDRNEFDVRVAYSYPYAGDFSLGERYISMPYTEFPTVAWASAIELYRAVASRIPPPQPVRFPHAQITPNIRPTGLTVVLVDQARAAEVPCSRLYYLESIQELQMQKEREVRVERSSWSSAELGMIESVTQAAKSIAWKHYSEAVGQHMFRN